MGPGAHLIVQIVLYTTGRCHKACPPCLPMKRQKRLQHERSKRPISGHQQPGDALKELARTLHTRAHTPAKGS